MKQALNDKTPVLTSEHYKNEYCCPTCCFNVWIDFNNKLCEYSDVSQCDRYHYYTLQDELDNIFKL